MWHLGTAICISIMCEATALLWCSLSNLMLLSFVYFRIEVSSCTLYIVVLWCTINDKEIDSRFGVLLSRMRRALPYYVYICSTPASYRFILDLSMSSWHILPNVELRRPFCCVLGINNWSGTINAVIRNKHMINFDAKKINIFISFKHLVSTLQLRSARFFHVFCVDVLITQYFWSSPLTEIEDCF